MLTLEYNGLEQSFADWGFDLPSAVCQRGNMVVDTYSVSMPVASIFTDPVIPFEGFVKIRRNGIIIFQGYCDDPILNGDGSGDRVTLQFLNAWQFAEETQFQQPRASRPTAVVDLLFPYTTDVNLFMKLGASNEIVPLTNGEQITEVLTFLRAAVIAQGYDDPFQIGTVDPDLPLPVYPATEMSCATAIQKCLELSPYATVAWDYATEPPTIHVRNRANLTTQTLAIANGVDHKALRIVPRHRLVPKAAVIQYRITGANGGTLSVAFQKDKFPEDGPEIGPRVVCQTMDLAGSRFSGSVLTATVQTASLAPTDSGQSTAAGRRAFWAQFYPELQDTTIRFRSFISNGTLGSALFTYKKPAGTDASGNLATFLQDYPGYTSYLINGTGILPWMKNGATAVGAVEVEVEIFAMYQRYDRLADNAGNPDASSNGVLLETSKEPRRFSVRLTATDALSQTYVSSTVTENVTAEEVPVGIAESLYNSLATLQYEGEDVRVEVECGNQVSLLNTLNLSGGRAEWASMQAQIQTITELEGSGETSVSFGPARHLNAGDLSAVWVYNRRRQITEPTSIRSSANLNSSGGSIQL